jgi:hypothetical protein
MTLCIVGFDDLVTSFVSTIATGWSDPCRVGLSPTGKPRLYAAHAEIGLFVHSGRTLIHVRLQCYFPRREIDLKRSFASL